MACSKAHIIIARRWRKRHPEKHRESVRRWKKKNPEKNLEYCRRQYAKNRKRRLEYQRDWYWKNKKRIAAALLARRLRNPAWFLFHQAKSRAKRNGIPFTIQVSDIVVPKVCPALGVRFRTGTQRDHHYSPSLDRIIPKLGYVPGNVVVLSHRANSMKRDASLKELQGLVRFLESLNNKNTPCQTS